MIKLKNLLNEGSPGFTDREYGDPLPTLKGIMEKKDKDHGLSSDVVKFKQEYSTQQGKLKEQALKLRERKQVMEAVGMINQSIMKMLGELNELPVVDALENVKKSNATKYIRAVETLKKICEHNIEWLEEQK